MTVKKSHKLEFPNGLGGLKFCILFVMIMFLIIIINIENKNNILILLQHFEVWSMIFFALVFSLMTDHFSDCTLLFNDNELSVKRLLSNKITIIKYSDISSIQYNVMKSPGVGSYFIIKTAYIFELRIKKVIGRRERVELKTFLMQNGVFIKYFSDGVESDI